MQAEEEAHPFLGGTPLTLFVGVGGELQGFVVSEVLRNPQAAPRSRTPDGRYAFVTHGGDGKVSVVDTERLSVQQVRVPTALRGGGYITAVQKGAEPVDLMAR